MTGRRSRGTMTDTRNGFTLIELMVVVLIIGILTAFAIPQYFKAVEVTKVDNAVAMIRSINSANRMWAQDHGGTFLTGELTTGICNTGSCTAANTCDLVKCKYIAPADWNNKSYRFFGCNGKAASSNCGGAMGESRNWVAGAVRRTGASPPGTDVEPYNTWLMAIDTNGGVKAAGTDPPAVAGF